MGMVLQTHSISDTNIDLAVKHPDLVWRVISPDDEEVNENSTSVASSTPVSKPYLFSRIFRNKNQKPEPVAAPPEVA